MRYRRERSDAHANDVAYANDVAIANDVFACAKNDVFSLFGKIIMVCAIAQFYMTTPPACLTATHLP